MRAGAVLLIVALAAALSVDVVKTGLGLKGDEATYVSMALSLALSAYWWLARRKPKIAFLSALMFLALLLPAPAGRSSGRHRCD